jgi:hypothetical protein
MAGRSPSIPPSPPIFAFARASLLATIGFARLCSCLAPGYDWLRPPSLVPRSWLRLASPAFAPGSRSPSKLRVRHERERRWGCAARYCPKIHIRCIYCSSLTNLAATCCQHSVSNRSKDSQDSRARALPKTSANDS